MLRRDSALAAASSSSRRQHRYSRRCNTATVTLALQQCNQSATTRCGRTVVVEEDGYQLVGCQRCNLDKVMEGAWVLLLRERAARHNRQLRQ